MAKHKNKHRQLPQQNPKPPPSTEGAAGKAAASGPVTAADITTPGTAIEAISKVHSQALETATEGDIEAATKAAPPGTDGLDIVKAAREPLSYIGVNVVGLRRRGFNDEQVARIEDIYREIFVRNTNVDRAVQNVLQTMPRSHERGVIVDFINNSPKGIMRGLAE